MRKLLLPQFWRRGGRSGELALSGSQDAVIYHSRIMLTATDTSGKIRREGLSEIQKEMFLVRCWQKPGRLQDQECI
jgi:hypothetical protein